MIAVDSSVVVAIFNAEPDASSWVTRILASDRRLMSAANWFEAFMVCLGKSKDTRLPGLFDALVEELSIEVVPLTLEHTLVARDAFAAFGKGRGHPAQLNYGDCFAYALAKSLDAPLLFKGDFAQTDVKAA
jgi:ribonuclease VapC